LSRKCGIFDISKLSGPSRLIAGLVLCNYYYYYYYQWLYSSLLGFGRFFNFCILYTFGLVGKPEGKRPLGRPRRRWIDNIKMDLLEIGVSVVDWIGLAQDRYRWRSLVNSVMNLRVPQNAGNYRVAAQVVAS
jgi:hypothetical protein